MVNRSVSPVITFHHVSKVFAGERTRDGVSATVHPAQLVAIIGRSGAAKTTLLRGLSPATVATVGTLRFAGEG